MVVKSPYPSVPVSTVPLHNKILSALLRHMDKNPNGVALISAEDPSKRITYREIYSYTLAMSSFLAQHDFGEGDVMCQVLPNCIEYVVGYLGALSCGGAMSGASAMFTDYELERQFLDSHCKVVVTDGDHLDKVLKATKDCPHIKCVICVNGSGSLPTRVYNWDQVIHTPIGALKQHTGSVDDLALLPYSSGTTGSPKGVMLTHRNFGTMIDIVVDHFDRTVAPKVSPDGELDWSKEHMLLVLPFYHIYGFGVLNQVLLKGITGVILNKFDVNVFLSSIERYKVRILMLVPPIVLLLNKHPLAAKYDLSSMQFILTGAAPLGREMCEELYKKYPHVKYLSQAYGMTECGMASHLPKIDRKDNYIAVGHIAATFEQKIVHPETGKEVKEGDRGEICVRGPTVMKGYLDRPQATAETIDQDGWLHTGDIGYCDEEGLTYIVDRLKELIKVKGLQVPPAELEDLLLSHPQINDAAVIGIPDERAGERPKAFVVRQGKTLTEREVQLFVESKVSSYKFLTGGVEFIEEIPKSAAGKILRRFLRERSKAKL